MKKRCVLLALLIICSILVTSGCDIKAIAGNKTSSENSTAFPTEEITEKKTCKVQLTSLDKQNLTDSVLYKIDKLSASGSTKVITEELTTTNGVAQIELESGEYRIAAITGDFEDTITIEEDEVEKNVTAENNIMYNILSKTDGVCVIGDSITIGSVSGGYGWYDGLIQRFPNIQFTDVAATGGQTSASIFDNSNDMSVIKNSKADTYIIALGINDVINRDKSNRATTYTTAEYIKNLEKLVRIINEKDNTKVNKFIFIAPFEYINRYSYVMTKYLRRDNTHEEYTIALYSWCNMNKYAFSAPMNYIKNTLVNVENASDYSVDDVHPSFPLGTQLYSEGVYESSVLNSTGTLNIDQRYFNEKERDKTESSYKTYPTDYVQAEVYADVLKETCFTIKDYNTGRYVVLKSNSETGQYQYEETSDKPHYYFSQQSDGKLTVSNMPVGGYTINFEYNKMGYKAYLDTETVFVNGGNITTNVSIYMKNKIE